MIKKIGEGRSNIYSLEGPKCWHSRCEDCNRNPRWYLECYALDDFFESKRKGSEMKKAFRYVGYCLGVRVCFSSSITHVKKKLAPHLDNEGSCRIFSYEFIPIPPDKYTVRCVKVEYLYKDEGVQ